MNTIAQIHSEVSLHTHDVKWIEHPPLGTKIVCEDGVVWLTQSDDHKDYILLAGEAFAITKRGKLLIEALHDAVVRIG